MNAAFDRYCNYDGAGGRFGDTSVSAQTSRRRDTSIYASVEGDDRVVLVVINKNAGAASADLTVRTPPTCAPSRTR